MPFTKSVEPGWAAIAVAALAIQYSVVPPPARYASTGFFSRIRVSAPLSSSARPAPSPSPSMRTATAATSGSSRASSSRARSRPYGSGSPKVKKRNVRGGSSARSTSTAGTSWALAAER